MLLVIAYILGGYIKVGGNPFYKQPTFDDGVIYGQLAVNMAMAQGRKNIPSEEAKAMAYFLWTRDNVNKTRR